MAPYSLYQLFYPYLKILGEEDERTEILLAATFLLIVILAFIGFVLVLCYWMYSLFIQLIGPGLKNIIIPLHWHYVILAKLEMCQSIFGEVCWSNCVRNCGHWWSTKSVQFFKKPQNLLKNIFVKCFDMSEVEHTTFFMSSTI